MTSLDSNLAARLVRAARSRWLHAGASGLLLVVLMGAGPAVAQGASADLVLASQTVAPDPVPAGGIATIEMRVENNGPGAASGVVLTDDIPAGSTFVSMGASQGSCTSAAPYTCNLGELANQGAATVTLKLRLPGAGVWPNTAALTAATADGNLGNNHLTRNITATAGANLGIVATSSVSGVIMAGTPFDYTLTVDNGGPDALPAGQSPTVVFNVPAGASLTGRPTGSGWTCAPANGYPLSAAEQISCRRDDGLASGDSFPPITVPVVGNKLGTVTGSFGVGSEFADGDLQNNAAIVDVALNAGTDMAVRKTVRPSGAVGVGAELAYTLTARQNGGVAPTGVTLTDVLPASLSYVSHEAPAPWACHWTAPALNCSYPGVWDGGPFSNLPPVVVRATVSGAGAVTNVGTVAADPPDPDESNNRTELTVTGSNDADLSIGKVASISPVVVGQAYGYTVRVYNNGPLAVPTGQTITVTENIPANMSLRGLPADSGWNCASSSNASFPQAGPVVLTCTRPGPLAVKQAVALFVPVLNTGAGELVNRACVQLSGPGPADSNAGNDCVGAPSTGTTQQADLSIVKTATPAMVGAGENLNYTLIVHNAGPDAASNVIVSDVLENLIVDGGLQSIGATQGSCTPAAPADGPKVTARCNLGTLASGASATVTLVVRPTNTGAANRRHSNTATVNSSDVGDPNRDNNKSTDDTVVVQPRVDMTVSKSVTPSPVRVGEPMTYVVTARNRGPSRASAVSIEDALPPHTAFIDLVGVSDNGSCSTPAADATSGALKCQWDSIAPGTQHTATFRVRPLAPALGTSVVNHVAVATDSVETDASNNRASAQAEVVAADLDILVHKTDSVDPMPLGGETEYTIAITNVGPSYGTRLVMTDTFPHAQDSARFSYQGGLVTSVPGTCTEPELGATSGTLECVFARIAPGEQGTITVRYKMRAESIVQTGDYSGTQGNHVVVKVDEQEREQANNATDEDTTTRRAAVATDLALNKLIDKALIRPGEQAVYTLKVTNNGPRESQGAQVIDPLPAGLSFVSSAEGCVSGAGGTVSCAVGTLPVGESRNFTVTVRLADPYDGPRKLRNTATVDAPGDTDPSNNEDSAETEVPGEGTLPPPTPVPTLGEWAMLFLLAGLAGLGGARLRRRGD